MSRRKQAKPRALKREEDWESDCGDKPPDGASAVDHDASVVGDSGGEQSSDAGANYDTSMDALQLALLERRGYGGGLPDSLLDGSRRGSPGETDNSLESDALGTSSWRSETPEEEGQTSPSPSSSATDVADADLAFTVGVTEGTPYACQFCDKAFPRLSYLKKHEQTHSDQMPFRCEFCSRLFKHKRSRDRHIKLHTGDKKYRCSHCEAAFSRSDHLKIHMKTHDNQKPFQCTVCNRGYNTAAALTSHMQNHKKESVGTPSPGSTFRCLSCGEAFRKPDDLQNHMASHHGSPGLGAALLTPKLACIYCTKDSFTTMEALQLHVQAMHGAIVNGDFSSPAASPTQAPPTPPPPPPPPPPPSLPFACDLCTMRFASPSGLHKHAAAVHCAEQLRPTDLSKKGRSAAQHHLSHSPPAAKRLRGGAEAATTPYEHPGTLLCNQCSAALPDFEAFRTHLKSHLLEETAGAVCRHCGAAFAGAEALWRHVGSHFLATASEFGCQSCLKQFRQPDDLQRHLLELHALHLYRCALCQELFESKVAIQVHFAVAHSSESRLFRCTACPGAAFRAEADFALHVRAAHAASPAAAAAPATPPPQHQQAVTTTQQQPPFRCLYCRLSFGSELEMQFHLAAHSKQFRCPVCHEAFHVEFLLDKHMASHHAAQILNGNSSTPENLSHLHQQKSPKSKTNPVRTSSGGSSSSDAPTSGVGDAELSSDAASVAASTATTTVTTLDKLSKAKGSSNKGGAGAAGAAAGVSLHCAYCSENCKSRTELENHMKTHSQGGAGGVGGKHKCNICDELCPSAAVLAEHKLTHCKVVSGNSCTQCKAALASEEQFVAHLRQHGGVGDGAVALPTPCVVCRQTLMSDVEVRVHAKFHLQQQPPPAPPTAQCCLCLRAVELPGAGLCADCAAPRKAVAAAAAAFRCLHCAASFESERDVQRHVSAAHAHSHGHERHECHLCRRGLDSPRQLQAHLIEHTFAGCGSFTCYLCSAVFTAAPGLQQHMLAHGPNARPYDCARCGLRFFFRAELDNHSYSHLERDEEIATKMAYYQHLNNNGTSEVAAKGKGRKGGGGGGHACADCGKEFSAARGLASHVRTAHPQVKREGVHACGVCSKEFLDVATLDSHVAALHPTVKQEPLSPPPPPPPAPAATTPATAHAAHDDADV